MKEPQGHTQIVSPIQVNKAGNRQVRIAMSFCRDIHSLHWINLKDFGNLDLTFSLVPP